MQQQSQLADSGLTSPNTVVLGLDSADVLLLERWVNDGHLPFFKHCLDSCPLVRLTTPGRTLQGAAWPSLLTGRSPGTHGLYLQSQLQTGAYAIVGRRADFVPSPYYYEYLLEAGLSCGIADVPVDRPARDFRGMHVIDWGTEFRFWGFETQPPELAKEIRRKIGVHPLNSRHSSGDSERSHLRLRYQLEDGVRKKTKLARMLLEHQELDHTFIVFSELHKAGHWFWKYWDLQHPDHESCKKELETALVDCYKWIDHALEDLVGDLSQDTNLIFFSNHGMQANYRGDHLIRMVLERMGYLVPKANSSIDDTSDKLMYAHSFLRSKLPEKGKGLLRRLVPRLLRSKLRRTFDRNATIDWAQTKAFVLPTDRNTYVRINLRGREPMGTVEPGADYRDTLQRIDEELRGLVNPATGGPAVEEVFHLHDIYPGKKSDDLPDIAVLWSADAPIDAVVSRSLGRISKPIRELRSGNHRSEGFLLAKGPAFVQGPQQLRGDVLQLAPTLLHLHGIEIPDEFEMEPLHQIFKKDSHAIRIR